MTDRILTMVKALAGTGKTTNSGWGMGKRVPPGVTPTEEQKAIIKRMRRAKGSKGACAFNRSIANELPDKMPPNVECATSNAFGHRAWCSYVDASKIKPDGYKTSKIASDIIGQDLPWAMKRVVGNRIAKVINLCKCFVYDPTTSEKKNWLAGELYVDGRAAVDWLVQKFGLDFDDKCWEYLPAVWEKGVEATSFIDFDDQNFLPLYHGIDLPVFDHLFVDEVQDLNRAKQMMAYKMGRHITAVGDINQAIYAFAGSDAESMLNMADRMSQMGDYEELPMTLTRRCPKSVVELANSIVPDLRCPDNAIEGSVSDMGEREWKAQLEGGGQMVLCRSNAPLTSLAFSLISRNIRCYIQGRDIGAGMKAQLRETNEKDLTTALSKVHDVTDRKCREIAGREFPDESLIELLRDRAVCISVIGSKCNTIEGFNKAVDGLFKDRGGEHDIQLSSCHKAKGLEHKKVTIYKSNLLMKRRKRQTEEEFQQEKNLAYVSYTRSMDELTRAYEEE